MMRSIPFTQFLFPDGRRTPVKIEMPDEICDKADEILAHGFVFEIENAAGVIHMTISDEEQDYACALCINGPDVVIAVAHMVMLFDIQRALRDRRLN